MSTGVWIALLGPLEVRIDDQVVDIAGARLKALLSRLAVEPGRRVSGSELLAAVWPDDPPGEPVNALQSLVSRLRRTLHDPGSISQETGGYRLTVPADQVDAGVFAERASRGHRDVVGDPVAAEAELVAALALWRGEPLADAGTGDYVSSYRARLTDRRLQAMKDRAEIVLARGGAIELVGELESLVEDHPLDEPLTGLLLRTLAAAGRTPEALVRFETLRSTLADELGTDPGPELRELHLALLRGELAPAVTAHPAGRIRRSNLRSWLTSFIGREAELDAISESVRRSRLTTIVGTGGAGKTRLATEVAARWLAAGSETAWLVELAPVTEAQNIAATILGALGFRDARITDRERPAQDDLERVLEVLRDARCLLVIDNCEHLIEPAAAVVDRILAEAGGVRVLATSREPLAITGETLHPIPPLGLPPADSDPVTAGEFASVQLWLDRARTVRRDFVLDEDTVQPVVEIVRRLDGLPLAIELAAARLRVLPLTEIARRLSDRFRLLTGGNRVAVPRHRTLRAVVEWSWDLLRTAERLLAERLAVFPAGADAEAATAICADDQLPAEEIDGLLILLVDKSLLQSFEDASGTLRFRMLETIREYGVERLAARDELEAARLAHARYFSKLTISLEPVIRSAEQLPALATLDLERENILAGLRFLGDSGRGGEALRLCLSMVWYWSLLGSDVEALTWLRFVIAANAGSDEPDLVYAEVGLAFSEITTAPATGGTEETSRVAGSAFVRARDRLASLSDRLLAGPGAPFPGVAALLPMISMYAGDVDLAEKLMDRALAEPDPWLHAALQASLASYGENNGDAKLMREAADAAYKEFTELGDRWGLTTSLLVRARVSTLHGELAEAIGQYEEAAGYIASLESNVDDAYVRIRLADLRARSGDLNGAVAELERLQVGSSLPSAETELFIGASMSSLEWQRGDETAALERGRRLRIQLRTSTEPSAMSGHMTAIVLGTTASLEARLGDVDTALADLAEAYTAGVGTADMPILASVGLAVCALAVRRKQFGEGALILGASAQVRGAEDESDPWVLTLRSELVDALGAAYEGCYGRGHSLSRPDAIARLDPALLVEGA